MKTYRADSSQSTEATRRWAVLVALVGLGTLAMVIASPFRRTDIHDRTAIVPTDSRPVAPHAVESGDGGNERTSERTTDGLGEQEVLLSGRVVAANSLVPLGARISASALSTDCDPAVGWFSLRVPGAHSVDLTVSCPGYHTRHLSVKSTDTALLGDIELVPSAFGIIRVVDESALPVPGADVEVWPRTHTIEGDADGPSQIRQPTRARTDEMGNTTLSIGSASWVFARSETRCSQAALLRPGDALDLLLPTTPVDALRLIQPGSNSGVAGRSVVLHARNEAGLATIARSSGDGTLEPSMPPGEYRVHCIDPDMGFTVTGDGNAHQSRSAMDVAIRRNAQVTPLEVSFPDDWRFLLVNRATNASLSCASARLSWFESSRELQDWMSVGSPLEMHPVNGALALRAVSPAQYGPNARIRLHILAPGFARYLLEDPHRRLLSGTPYRVELEPIRDSAVRLIDTNGTPYRGNVVVREGYGEFSRGGLVVRTRPDANGIVGPIRSSGGSLTVLAATGYSFGTVTPESLRDDASVPSLTIPTPAQIDVEIPAGVETQIYCVSDLKGRLSGVRSQNRISFVNLTPGRYRVGPLESMECVGLAVANGIPAHPIEVGPGERRAFAWNESWNPGQRHRSRVVARGVSLADLAVIPLFGDRRLPIATPDLSRRLQLDPHGWFEVKGGDVAPSEIAVVLRSRPGPALPLAVSALRAEIRVECGSVRLRDRTSSASGAMVELVPEIDGREVQSVFRVEVPPGGEAVLPTVPCSTRHLTAYTSRGSTRVPVVVDPEKETVVDLSDRRD